jgi:hypothetical protein
MRVVWRVGVKAPYRAAFWRFLLNIVRTTPRLFARGIAQAVNGEHVIRFTRDDVIPRLLAAEKDGARAPQSTLQKSDLKAIPRQVALASFARSAEMSRLAQLRRSAGSDGLKL